MGEAKEWVSAIANFVESGGTRTVSREEQERKESRERESESERREREEEEDLGYD